jgi:hypothetical protein
MMLAVIVPLKTIHGSGAQARSRRELSGMCSPVQRDAHKTVSGKGQSREILFKLFRSALRLT